MDLDARVDVSYARIDVNFEKRRCSLNPLYFFYFDTSEHLDPLLLRTKFQQHKQSYYGEKVCFNGFDIFSISVVSF